jgi:hypothetical protein
VKYTTFFVISGTDFALLRKEFNRRISYIPFSFFFAVMHYYDDLLTKLDMKSE